MRAPSVSSLRVPALGRVAAVSTTIMPLSSPSITMGTIATEQLLRPSSPRRRASWGSWPSSGSKLASGLRGARPEPRRRGFAASARILRAPRRLCLDRDKASARRSRAQARSGASLPVERLEHALECCLTIRSLAGACEVARGVSLAGANAPLPREGCHFVFDPAGDRLRGSPFQGGEGYRFEYRHFSPLRLTRLVVHCST